MYLQTHTLTSDESGIHKITKSLFKESYNIGDLVDSMASRGRVNSEETVGRGKINDIGSLLLKPQPGIKQLFWQPVRCVIWSSQRVVCVCVFSSALGHMCECVLLHCPGSQHGDNVDSATATMNMYYVTEMSIWIGNRENNPRLWACVCTMCLSAWPPFIDLQ